jgi:hypothetical protein
MQHDATCFVTLCVSMHSVVAYMPRGGVYASCPRTGFWYSNMFDHLGDVTGVDSASFEPRTGK